MEQTRELDKSEKYLVDPNSVSNLVVPTKLITKTFLDTVRLEKAIYKFIKSQPNLNAVVKREGNKLFFAPLQEIKDYFVLMPSHVDWKEICIEYSNNQFRKDFETYPPFKVFFIQPSKIEAYLIVIFSHYAMDGTNGISSTSDILEIYSKLKLDPHFEPVHHQPAPSVDQLKRSLLTDSEIEEYEEKFKNYHLDIYDSINCTIPVHDDTARVLFLSYSSTESVYNEFRTECRRRGFTLGVALCAANFFAFAACIFSRLQNLPEELYLAAKLPMNIRGRMVSLEKMPWRCGNLAISTPYVAVNVRRDSTLWQLAGSIRDQLTYLFSDKSKLYMFDMHTLYKRLTTPEDKERFSNGKKQMNGLKRHCCFSNMKWYLGEIDHDEFTVDSVLCTGGPSITGSSVFESYVYTTRKLHFTMLYRDETENEDCAREVMHYIQYLVENAPTFSDKDITLDEALKNCPYSNKPVILRL